MRRGFSLIELVVTIGVTGLLATIAIVSLNTARIRARDAKRIADVKQMVTALERYFADSGAYPIEGATVTLGSASETCLSSGGGFAATCTGTTYMNNIPASPTPAPAGAGVCSGAAPHAGYCYLAAAPGASFAITFSLEGAFGGMTDTGDADSVVDCTATLNSIICD